MRLFRAVLHGLPTWWCFHSLQAWKELKKGKAEILILTLLQVGRGELNFRTQNVMFISKVKICLPLHHETLLLS